MNSISSFNCNFPGNIVDVQFTNTPLSVSNYILYIIVNVITSYI